MKIVYDGNDEEILNNGWFANFIKPNEERPRDIRVVTEGNHYSIDFRVVDEAKANMFIQDIIFGCMKLAKQEEIINIIGIQFEQLNFDSNRKTEEILGRLSDLIDEYQ